jgi:hypothetical protein
MRLTPCGGFVYLIRSPVTGWYKVGRAFRIANRMRDYDRGTGIRHELIGFWFSWDYTLLEVLIHQEFQHRRVIGEWFDLNQEEVDQICQLEHHAVPEIRRQDFEEMEAWLRTTIPAPPPRHT